MTKVKERSINLPRKYIFPLILLCMFMLVSLLGFSGSSVGIYDYIFGDKHDSTVLGRPRPVRSDEWLVTTPLTIAQSKEGFPVTNTDIASGEDMSVAIDVPYADWSTLFRPQNIPFLIVPLEIAFAMKWWILAFLLMMGIYAFVLLLYPGKYVAASFVALFFVFNPFIQWWYQSATLLPIAYGFFGIVVCMRLLQTTNVAHRVFYTMALAYIAVAFALIMYPAFQIIIAIVCLTIIVSLLAGNRQLPILIQKRNLLSLGVACFLSLLLVGLYLFQHKEAVQATLSTVYPGSRNVESGGFGLSAFSNWPYSYLLLNDANPTQLGNNQSEASNFMLVGLVALPFLIFETLRKKSRLLSRSERYVVTGIVIVVVLLVCRMTIPIANPLFSLLGLSKVPHVRLLIGFGIINIVILMVLLLRRGQKLPHYSALLNRKHTITTLLLFGIYSALCLYALKRFGISSVGWKEYLVVCSILTISTSLLLSEFKQPRYVGLLVVSIFTIASTVMANPLQKGVVIPDTSFSKFVSVEENKNKQYWISNASSPLTAMLVASGAEVQGGVNAYPQLHMWREYFPESEVIFNRYAHIKFHINQSLERRQVELLQADSFQVSLPDCDQMLVDLKIGYIISETAFANKCYPYMTKKQFNEKTLYIYTKQAIHG